MYKSYRDDIAQDYGMPYLFVRYVIDRMAGSYEPMAVLPRFYTVDASSLTCEAYLEKVTGIPFKHFFQIFIQLWQQEKLLVYTVFQVIG